MLYFGQEVGERGMDNEPFSGVNGRTSIFDWWTVESLQALREYIDNPHKGLNTRQKAILKRYRHTLGLSKLPAFAEGRTYDLCYCQGEGFNPDRHFAFLRADDAETWLVIANFGSAAPITVSIPAEAGTAPQTVTKHVPAQDFVAIRI